MFKKTSLTLMAVAASGLFFACGDDTGTGGAGATTSSATTVSATHATVSASSTHAATSTHASNAASTSTGMAFPVPPVIGVQIDRMGRPAINTALDETFVVAGTATAVTDPQRAAAEDAYNADDDPTGWVAAYNVTMASQLGVIDSLNSIGGAGNDGCGNQLLAGGGTAAGTYTPLANILANDQLWVKTGAATCTTYLGVEAQATIIPALNDCGGRRLTDDVIDESYSILAIGAVTGVADGITSPDNAHQAAYPYYADPH